MPLELWITTSFQRVLFILRVPVCQRCSTIQRFGTNGIDGSGTVWKCSSDAKVSKHCKNCWGWNIWSYMHFCWIAAALLENIILHWAYGCLGNMIPMPLGVLDLRLTDGGLPCIRRLWELHRGAAHPGNVFWKGFLVFGALSSFGDRYLRVQILSLMCEYILCQSPKQATEHVSIPTGYYLVSVCLFRFHQGDIYIKSNCDLEFCQWIHVFQNLCSLSYISHNGCFWVKSLFNLPTQCECNYCLLQWRSCSWRTYIW